jgi:hypothetical protein
VSKADFESRYTSNMHMHATRLSASPIKVIFMSLDSTIFNATKLMTVYSLEHIGIDVVPSPHLIPRKDVSSVVNAVNQH